MSTYEYITKTLTTERFSEMVKYGLIPLQTAVHFQMYEWHIHNGRSRFKTAQHFKVSTSLVGYAVGKMSKPI